MDTDHLIKRNAWVLPLDERLPKTEDRKAEELKDKIGGFKSHFPVRVKKAGSK
jgi:hypothetical protein